MRDDQLHALRGLLAGALAAQKRQYDHSAALWHMMLDTGDDHATSHDRELVRAAADRAGDAIGEIEAALDRLAEGTYGTCESCSRPIPFERLEAISQARYCVACPRPSGPLR